MAIWISQNLIQSGRGNELPRGKPRGIKGETTTWNESPRSGLRGNHLEASFGVLTRGAITGLLIISWAIVKSE